MMLAAVASLAAAAAPAANAAEGADPALEAYLDGKPIPLEDVGKYYCDDFDYPVINCSRTALLPQARGTLLAVLAGVDYVSIYDGGFYGGSMMHVSADYPSLLTIGWNDKISSFKGRNSETGQFTTDWFYGGSSWAFCCNSTVSSLGSWSNTFSALRRT